MTSEDKKRILSELKMIRFYLDRSGPDIDDDRSAEWSFITIEQILNKY